MSGTSRELRRTTSQRAWTSSMRGSSFSREPGSGLPLGLIFEIAEAAGIEIKSRKPKSPIRCPLHEDRHASAFLSEDNVFFCSVCTVDGGMSAKDFAAALNVDFRSLVATGPRPLPTPKFHAKPPSFTPDDAARVWERARDRMRDDGVVEADRQAWEFIAGRGLGEAWEISAFGVLSSEMALPDPISHWPLSGYRILVPLYDQGGVIANVQARNVLGRTPKTMFPKGSRASGTLFACSRGVRLLAGENRSCPHVLLGEGLTDFLALAITACVPVLSAPGAGMATSSIGSWVRGATLCLALDTDGPGSSAARAAIDQAYRMGAEKVRRVTWPSHAKDACQVLEAHGSTGLSEFLERNLFGGRP